MYNMKVLEDLTTYDIVMTMINGDHRMMSIVTDMVISNDPRKLLDIVVLDSLNIRGRQLFVFYNVCCDGNEEKFARTMHMIKESVFTDKKIKANLSQDTAIPFIDDSIVIEGVPSYEESFGPMDEKWAEYCAAQKGVFKAKIAPVLKQQKGRSKK